MQNLINHIYVYNTWKKIKNENKPLAEKEVEKFLMDNSEAMEKAIIQEIKQGFLTKDGDKIVRQKNLKDVTLSDLVDRKRAREKYKMRLKQEEMMGDEIDLDEL